jgi:hypothetical protein
MPTETDITPSEVLADKKESVASKHREMAKEYIKHNNFDENLNAEEQSQKIESMSLWLHAREARGISNQELENRLEEMPSA